jgi:hypothetical protein
MYAISKYTLSFMQIHLVKALQFFVMNIYYMQSGSIYSTLYLKENIWTRDNGLCLFGVVGSVYPWPDWSC